MEQKKSSMEKLELKILIIGNLGYIGPILVQHLSEKKIGSLTGLDNGYFRKCLVEPNLNPEFLLLYICMQVMEMFIAISQLIQMITK